MSYAPISLLSTDRHTLKFDYLLYPYLRSAIEAKFTNLANSSAFDTQRHDGTLTKIVTASVICSKNKGEA